MQKLPRLVPRLIMGFALVAIGTLWGSFLLNNYDVVSVPTAPVPQTVAAPVKVIIRDTPTRLVIERLGIDLSVTPGTYNPATQTWTLNNSHVFVSTFTSPAPVVSTEETDSRVLLYGHNYQKILGKTVNLHPGDTVRIFTAKGYEFVYKYARDEVTTPADDRVLQAGVAEPLTIMTCVGTWDEKRRLMHFDFVELRKPANLS